MLNCILITTQAFSSESDKYTHIDSLWIENIQKWALEYMNTSADYDNVLKFIDKSLKLSEKSKNKVLMAKGYFLLGIFYEKQHNYNLALENYNKSINLFYKAGNHSIYIQVLKRVANIHLLRSNYTDACDNYFNVLRLYRKYFPDSTYIGTTYMAIIYMRKGDQIKANNYLEKVQNIINKTKDTILLSNIYHLLGDFYRINRNDKQAFNYYNKAIRLIPDSSYNGLLLSYKIGNYFLSIHDTVQALDYYQRIPENFIRNNFCYYHLFIPVVSKMADIYPVIPSQKRLEYNKYINYYYNDSLKKLSQLKKQLYQYEWDDRQNELHEISVQNKQIIKKTESYMLFVKWTVIGGIILIIILISVIFVIVYYRTRHKKESKNLKTVIQAENKTLHLNFIGKNNLIKKNLYKIKQLGRIKNDYVKKIDDQTGIISETHKLLNLYQEKFLNGTVKKNIKIFAESTIVMYPENRYDSLFYHVWKKKQLIYPVIIHFSGLGNYGKIAKHYVFSLIQDIIGQEDHIQDIMTLLYHDLIVKTESRIEINAVICKINRSQNSLEYCLNNMDMFIASDKNLFQLNPDLVDKVKQVKEYQVQGKHLFKMNDPVGNDENPSGRFIKGRMRVRPEDKIYFYFDWYSGTENVNSDNKIYFSIFISLISMFSQIPLNKQKELMEKEIKRTMSGDKGRCGDEGFIFFGFNI